MNAFGRCTSCLLTVCLTSMLAADEIPVIQLPRSAAERAVPGWATAQRQLLDEQAAACREFYDRYFDERGWLQCVERWGGDDGPDDAIECVADWPLLYALGADDVVMELYRRAWEGHLQQYTAAKTREVELAREGMYWREFPVVFDWVHHGEGLTAFLFAGLAAPHDEKYQQRLERFANFYTGADPEAPNYDPQRRVIRSLFNGSRGPLLRPATALDWAGDPIDVTPFKLQHGERSYEEMLAHFRDYNDIVGDHPQNLCTTSLAFYAYALTGDDRYRRWTLEYVDAWLERMEQNGGVIPSKVGLDGRIGGDAGKWYGGVYGWAFSVTVPQTGETAHRNTHHLALVGLGNATLLTGDAKYARAWRRQIDAVNSRARRIDGQTQYPHMYGDQGWYHFTPEPYRHGAAETRYWLSGELDERPPADAAAAQRYPWEEAAKAAELAFQVDLERVRNRVAAMRADTTTPATRLADDPLALSPAAPAGLVRWSLGGLYPGHNAGALHAAVRYFDPVRRRPGLPADVAAIVETATDSAVYVALVNLNPNETRELIVQAGAYGEHAIRTAVRWDWINEMPVNDRWVKVVLEPGAQDRVVLKVQRYARQPTLAPPWEGE